MGLEKGSGNSERWVLEKDHGAGPTLHENFRVCAEMRSYKISLVWLAAERIPAYSILFGAPCSLLLPLFFSLYSMSSEQDNVFHVAVLYAESCSATHPFLLFPNYFVPAACCGFQHVRIFPPPDVP